MSEISFFVPKGPFYLNDLSSEISDKNSKLKISDIKTLDRATKKDITFFNSIDYKSNAKKTKAAACVTTKNLEQYLPEGCIKILVKNVLFSRFWLVVAPRWSPKVIVGSDSFKS